jgi:hypothetical protein
MSVVSPSKKNARTIQTSSSRTGGLSANEVRTALLRAAYMLHATRVIGWKDGTPAPKKG